MKALLARVGRLELQCRERETSSRPPRIITLIAPAFRGPEPEHRLFQDQVLEVLAEYDVVVVICEGRRCRLEPHPRVKLARDPVDAAFERAALMPSQEGRASYLADILAAARGYVLGPRDPADCPGDDEDDALDPLCPPTRRAAG